MLLLLLLFIYIYFLISFLFFAHHASVLRHAHANIRRILRHNFKGFSDYVPAILCRFQTLVDPDASAWPETFRNFAKTFEMIVIGLYLENNQEILLSTSRLKNDFVSRFWPRFRKNAVFPVGWFRSPRFSPRPHGCVFI